MLIGLTCFLQATIHLSDEQIEKLGHTIWHSECNGSLDGLLAWNNGEPFPSLGIGHFIWYPLSCTEKKFEQTFPDLIAFLIQHKVTIEPWLIEQCKLGCPWLNKQAFIAAKKSEYMQSLHALLQRTIHLQARFIVYRFEQELEKNMMTIAQEKRELLQRRIHLLAQSYQGTFALIDYVHFKGSGANPSESYQGHAWGLLHVLEQMRLPNTTDNAILEFVRTAKELLANRVEHAPNKDQERKWLKGWHARIDRYLQV